MCVPRRPRWFVLFVRTSINWIMFQRRKLYVVYLHGFRLLCRTLLTICERTAGGHSERDDTSVCFTMDFLPFLFFFFHALILCCCTFCFETSTWTNAHAFVTAGIQSQSWTACNVHVGVVARRFLHSLANDWCDIHSTPIILMSQMHERKKRSRIHFFFSYSLRWVYIVHCAAIVVHDESMREYTGEWERERERERNRSGFVIPNNKLCIPFLFMHQCITADGIPRMPGRAEEMQLHYLRIITDALRHWNAVGNTQAKAPARIKLLSPRFNYAPKWMKENQLEK